MKIKMEGKKLYNILNSASALREEGIIQLKDDRWLLKVSEPSDAGMYACLTPESSMEEYNKGDIDEIAVKFEELKDFAPNTKDTVTFTHDAYKSVYKTVIQHGGREFRTSAIDLQSVQRPPENFPTGFDSPVQFTTDPDLINDFAKDCSSKIGSSSLLICPRDGLLYLYSKQDDSELIERYHWEDMIDYNIDWSKAVPRAGAGDVQNAPDPEEEHAIDVILSVDLIRETNFWSDEVQFNVDNHMPIKAVFEDEGIKGSYIIAPRIPDDGQAQSLPENVIKERGLETV